MRAAVVIGSDEPIEIRETAPVPAGIDRAEAAPLARTDVISYRAIKVGGVTPGDRVAIFGIGALPSDDAMSLPIFQTTLKGIRVVRSMTGDQTVRGQVREARAHR